MAAGLQQANIARFQYINDVFPMGKRPFKTPPLRPARKPLFSAIPRGAKAETPKAEMRKRTRRT